jgi:hypothetical protein
MSVIAAGVSVKAGWHFWGSNYDTQAADRPLSAVTAKAPTANNGTTYDASIMRREDGNLLLRGYIGVPLLGKDAEL